MQHLFNKVEQWIDQTNIAYGDQRESCSRFADDFTGFYKTSFLQQSYFVVVDNIPRPNLPELQLLGLGPFITLPVAGITYKNTYYLLPESRDDLRLHFHELVHIAQWQHLGAMPFMKRYLYEIQNWGYDNAPLEKMAYAFDSHFSQNGEKIDVVDVVNYTLEHA